MPGINPAKIDDATHLATVLHLYLGIPKEKQPYVQDLITEALNKAYHEGTQAGAQWNNY